MSLAFVGSDAAWGRSSEEFPPQPICLIVEDQALIGLALQAYLEEMGLACVAFLSGAKALAWLAANTPTVAILDYALKDGPCTALTSVLGQRGIPFVIYSGYERSFAPPDLQAVPWINKPCNQEALLAALNRAAPALAAYQRTRHQGRWELGLCSSKDDPGDLGRDQGCGGGQRAQL